MCHIHDIIAVVYTPWVRGGSRISHRREATDHAELQRSPRRSPWWVAEELKTCCPFSYKRGAKVKDLRDNLLRVSGRLERLLLTVMANPYFLPMNWWGAWSAHASMPFVKRGIHGTLVHTFAKCCPFIFTATLLEIFLIKRRMVCRAMFSAKRREFA